MDILKSRTIWMGVLMFILGGVQAINEFMPEELFVFVQGVLALGVAYFRVNARVVFK